MRERRQQEGREAETITALRGRFVILAPYCTTAREPLPPHTLFRDQVRGGSCRKMKEENSSADSWLPARSRQVLRDRWRSQPGVRFSFPPEVSFSTDEFISSCETAFFFPLHTVDAALLALRRKSFIPFLSPCNSSFSPN